MTLIDQIMEGRKAPYAATDIIIEYSSAGKQGIVLVQRRYPPLGLALPGGIAEWGLSYEENAIKEAREETGLEVLLESPEQPLCVHSSPGRDPRGHVTSITFIGKGYGTLQAGDDASHAGLYSIPEVVVLLRHGQIVFDHDRILQKYLAFRGYNPEVGR